MAHFENLKDFQNLTKIVRHSTMAKILRILASKPPPHRGLENQIRRIWRWPSSQPVGASEARDLPVTSYQPYQTLNSFFLTSPEQAAQT